MQIRLVVRELQRSPRLSHSVPECRPSCHEYHQRPCKVVNRLLMMGGEAEFKLVRELEI